MTANTIGRPQVSVIIPTYNRQEALLRTLDSLGRQTLPINQYEVVVVDDGSTDDTSTITDLQFDYTLVYCSQQNEGATIARNRGAVRSRGVVLVFIDDDIEITPKTLELLYRLCVRNTKTIAMGVLTSPDEIKTSVFSRLVSLSRHASNSHVVGTGDTEVHFSQCKTGLLAIKRVDFFDLGMFNDPTGGWPNWDDFEFGYRAYQQSFKFYLSLNAIGKHWDYALANLTIACHRWERASESAVRLFQKYPRVKAYLPMFNDKTPIKWSQDSPRLILRKMARRVSSTRIALSFLELSAYFFERVYPSPSILKPLYRWITGGYIYIGFQKGLQQSEGWNQ